MTSITSICEPIEVYFYVHQVIFKDQKVRPMQSNCFKAGSKLSAFLEDLSCLEDECIIPLALSLEYLAIEGHGSQEAHRHSFACMHSSN